MDRLACVEVPALPLQLLLRAHADWKDQPVAVVDGDRPQGKVLWANDKARSAGILSGVRYGQGLSLLPTLRAGTLAEAEIQQGVVEIGELLARFSPRVEPSSSEPGVFWLDAGGLEGLFDSLEAWAQALRAELSEAGYVGAVVVGFGRFGSYAAVKLLKGRRSVVIESLAREEQIMHGAPLELVGLAPGPRDALAALGVRRVGELLRLSAQSLRRRFGLEVHELYRFAAGEREVPLSARRPLVLPEARLELEYREDNAERLVFLIKPLVDGMLLELSSRGLALLEVSLRLVLDDTPEQVETLRTAEPTLSSVTIMELVALRLAATELPSPAVEVTMRVTAAEPASEEQLRLFESANRRDPAAAERAFARLRAAFGREDVVARAVLRDRHAPEGRFAWEPMHRLEAARPVARANGMLVRRILASPESLAPPPERPSDWQPRGSESGGLHHLLGPYRISGGWWHGEIQRDYYFAETHRGEWLWVYHDRLRRRWFLQGEMS